MTNGQLYARAMTATRCIIDQVPGEQWHAPTPCAEWDARQVANHLIGENLWAAELFQGKTVAEVGTRLDGDLTGDDPAAAYRQSVEVARQAIERPVRWRRRAISRSATIRAPTMPANCSWTR